MKEIANLAGVSRGTVDRVLNERGAVSAKTSKKVLEIAKALDYAPNKLGQQLSIKKRHLKFGYILFSAEEVNPFFKDISDGIKAQALDLKDYGAEVILKYSNIQNPQSQIELLDQLVAANVDGIAITPMNHPDIISKIDQLHKSGIPVVTTNTDLPQSKRIAYVGSDYAKSGRTAGGILKLITNGDSKVGVVIGSPLILCHAVRAKSFENYISENLPRTRIVASIKNNDDDFISYERTKQMLEGHPEIDALFLASGGVQGACRAVMDLNLVGKIKILCYDTPNTTMKLIKSDVISAAITQEPFVQGAKPLSILLDYVGLGTPPEKKVFHTEIQIMIKENI